jgi:putative methionine-R-sulfoxide reductase with GAF domain
LFTVEKYQGDRKDAYQLLIKQLEALLAGETNRIANLSNASALLNQFFEEVNWVGFYLYDGKELVPIRKDGQLIGILDIDSPRKSRFDEVDQVYLEQFVQALLPFL